MVQRNPRLAWHRWARGPRAHVLSCQVSCVLAINIADVPRRWCIRGWLRVQTRRAPRAPRDRWVNSKEPAESRSSIEASRSSSLLEKAIPIGSNAVSWAEKWHRNLIDFRQFLVYSCRRTLSNCALQFHAIFIWARRDFSLLAVTSCCKNAARRLG